MISQSHYKTVGDMGYMKLLLVSELSQHDYTLHKTGKLLITARTRIVISRKPWRAGMKLVNYTIDDQYGDEVTGRLVR